MKKNSAYTEYINSPLGIIKIDMITNKVISISFVKTKAKTKNSFSSASIQLKEYFNGKRKKFTIKYHQKRTSLQASVYSEIINIPFGKTRTYGEIASRIHNPNASRAVGQACKKNNLPIIIPCHRVVGEKNKYYYNGGSEKKKILMRLEGII